MKYRWHSVSKDPVMTNMTMEDSGTCYDRAELDATVEYAIGDEGCIYFAWERLDRYGEPAGALHVEKDVDMSRKDFIAGYMVGRNGMGKMAWNSPKEIPAVAEDFINHCESIGNPVSDASEIYEFADFLEQRYASRKCANGRKDFMAGNRAMCKRSSNPGNILMLDDRHAEIAARAIDIFNDDAELLGYDLSDSYECELGVAEAVTEAAYELGVEMSLMQEQEVIDAVVQRLRLDGVIAKRRSSNLGYKRLMRKRGGSFYDKMFGEGEKIHEILYGHDADGKKYKVEIWESSEPGTWGQANFNYSIVDADDWSADYVGYHDYIMKMDRLHELLDEDLAKNGITLD